MVQERAEKGAICELIVVGSGPSTGLPLLACLDPEKCATCASGRSSPDSPNRRANSSLLVRTRQGANILIDCGKTFYGAALRTLVPLGIRRIDAVILSHGHADALLGLDDLRHYAPSPSPLPDRRAAAAPHGPLRVYCDRETMDVVRSTFPYLVDVRTATGSGEVASLWFGEIERDKPFSLFGLAIEPLVVEHGRRPDGTPFPALAFLLDGGRVLYMSDVSRVPESVFARLASGETGLEHMFVDCLHPDGDDYISHFGWPSAGRTIARCRPRFAWLVGMSHRIEHDSFNSTLPAGIQCAYDGLRLLL